MGNRIRARGEIRGGFMGLQMMHPTFKAAGGDLATALMDRFKIFTVAIDTAGVTGVRVTPQLFTTTAELDAFVRAITQLAA